MVKLRVTITHVAELAQASRMSVSHTLNSQSGVPGETRRHVLEAAHQLESALKLLILDFAGASLGAILRGDSGAAETLSNGLVCSIEQACQRLVGMT